MRFVDRGQSHLPHYQRRLPDVDSLRREILHGLRQRRKHIDAKFHYDDTGEALFERVTRLPEYYLTRVEREILRQHRSAIAALVGPDCVLLEPGCGNGEKAALLFDALHPAAYVGWDISERTLQQTLARLSERFPWLRCFAVACDYNAPLILPEGLPEGRRVVFLPGSTLGNFEPKAQFALLQRLWELAGVGGGLLIGVDLVKAPDLLLRAYNDRQSVNAAFNKNCLRHINALTGSHFSSEAFEHHVAFDADAQRIDIALRSRYAHRVDIGAESFAFAAGELVHTGIACKYTVPGFTALAARARFRRRKLWTDRQHLFAVFYLSAEPEPVLEEFDPAAQELMPSVAPHIADQGPYDIPDRRH